jgi:hypothetical protein
MLAASALAVFFTWAVIAIALIGIGSIVLALFSKDYPLADAFWMGLSVSVALLEIWNLLLPVTSSITVLLFSAGVAGLTLNRSILFNRLKTRLRTSRWLILLGIVIVMFVAFRACGPCDYYDTGLYGAPAVRWITMYPTVPGLANLHGRLGFNSSVFLCLAALDQGVWKGLGHHLFTGLVVAAVCITVLPACLRIVRRCGTSPTDWFHGILAIPIMFWATRSKIVGTLTDEPAAIACLAAVGILFDELRLKNGEDHRNSDQSRVVVATSLLALAVTFKESTLVFALLAWCLAFSRIWLMCRTARKRRVYIAGALVLSTMILLPWGTRGIILSGYPFYPAPVLGYPGDWRNPRALANWYATGTRSWGRNPDALFLADTEGFAWLGPWLSHSLRNRVSFQVPVGISLGGLAFAMGHRVRGKNRPVCPSLWLLLPSVAGIVFWFMASPDLRFAQFAIWTTAGTLGTWGIVSIASGPQGGRASTVLAVLSGLLIWCLISFGWKEPYRSLLAVRRLAPLPKVSLRVRQTRSGLAVYVPTEGDNCWDAPLPCTPYFDETLRLRNRQSMSWGFASAFASEAQKDFATPIRSLER